MDLAVTCSSSPCLLFHLTRTEALETSGSDPYLELLLKKKKTYASHWPTNTNKVIDVMELPVGSPWRHVADFPSQNTGVCVVCLLDKSQHIFLGNPSSGGSCFAQGSSHLVALGWRLVFTFEWDRQRKVVSVSTAGVRPEELGVTPPMTVTCLIHTALAFRRVRDLLVESAVYSTFVSISISKKENKFHM